MAVLLGTTALVGVTSVIGHSESVGAMFFRTYFTPCFDRPLSPLNTSINLSNHTIKVLQLDPGSKGYLCLNYQFHNGVPSGFTPNVVLTVVDSTGAFACGVNNGTIAAGCQGIHIASQLGEVDYAKGYTVIGVNITTDSTVRQGPYWLQIEPCSPTVMFVGQPPSNISEWVAGGMLLCVTVFGAPSVSIIGVIGFRTMTLNFSG